GSVLVLTSQPFVRLSPSQSAKPATQVPSQLPEPQVRVAMPVLEQDWLQPPQWPGSVFVLRSQPVVCLLASQSAKPAAQVPLQIPLPHDTVAMLLAEHTRPQRPQFCGSL